jgi:hypothetical protein
MQSVENLYYDIFPRIVRAHHETLITVRPRFTHSQFTTAADEPASRSYHVSFFPVEGLAGLTQWPAPQEWDVCPEQGELRVTCSFEGEQEYILRVEGPKGERPLKLVFHLYALEADLFSRRPFKGDFHMHSHRSDGKEAPGYVAASCRKIGMDFMALTDHHQYAPSLEAIAAFAGAPADLRIYPGEEVHAPGNLVHIVNFGGSFSVNERFSSPEFAEEVQALAESLNDLPAQADRHPYAACAWVFDQIRRGGGLGVFCHPYWISRDRSDVPGTLNDLLFERQPYDALELIGGYHRFEIDSNTLQVARYHEERARGRRIPVVGVSDAHGCDNGSLFGWYYTVAFAPSTDLPDLVQSIKDLYSVAVEALPGEVARSYGPFRLVRYTQFLLREVFPTHDALCQEEGRCMLAHLEGDPQAVDLLRAMSGRTARLREHIWER